MREIKFRAWNKKKKKMTSDYPSGWYVNFFGDVFENQNPDLIGESIDFKEMDVILMQYTGLKDKNGEEICEGDILKWEVPKCIQRDISPILKPVMIYQCKRGDGGFGTCIGFVFDPINIRKHVEYKFVHHVSKDCEVIGNIHDNPELLKVKK